MKLCNDTITVFNKRIGDNGGYEYIPTIINGVSWFCRIKSTVDEGLKAANEFIIRIPADANFNGKEYVDSVEYENAASIDGIFTLAQGDVIVKASVAVAPMTFAELKEHYSDYCTVLGVTDNRRAPNAPHFRVVGS